MEMQGKVIPSRIAIFAQCVDGLSPVQDEYSTFVLTRFRPWDDAAPGLRGIELGYIFFVTVCDDAHLTCYSACSFCGKQGSFGAMVVVNTSHPFPSACVHFPEKHVRGSAKKRRRSMSAASVNSEGPGTIAAEEESSCTLCFRYNSMLYMDCIEDNEMVIVEQPWLNVVSTFPDALQRRVYGT
jgi:hypothetical protein